MDQIGLYIFLPGIAAAILGIIGGAVGMAQAQSNGGGVIERGRWFSGVLLSLCCSYMISLAFSDSLLNEQSWFFYARRDALASFIICFLLMKGVPVDSRSNPS